MLREQKLPVSGNKAALVDRLLCNITDVPIPDTEVLLDTTDSSPHEVCMHIFCNVSKLNC
jgi:hypothetical protein